jgi:hypothetical protein
MRSNVWAMPALLGFELAQNIDLSKVEGVFAPRIGPVRNALLEDPKIVYVCRPLAPHIGHLQDSATIVQLS